MNYLEEKQWLDTETEKAKIKTEKLQQDTKHIDKLTKDMSINRIYNNNIYERYKDLLDSGKTSDGMTNNDLWKIFEYYSCIKLSQQFGKRFYEYDDIDPDFKELNGMTHNDTGIDASD